YTMVACVRVVALLSQSRSAHQRAQLQWLALGLVCGFMPLVLLTLLPLILVGHPLLPAQGSILALGLLPVSVGTAIVRTEFFGITSLLHRRTLRLGLI